MSEATTKVVAVLLGGVAVAAVLVNSSPAHDSAPSGCRRLQQETLADPEGLLAVVQYLENKSMSNGDDLALAAQASQAAGPVAAAVQGRAPADVYEQVESLRMMCAIAAR